MLITTDFVLVCVYDACNNRNDQVCVCVIFVGSVEVGSVCEWASVLISLKECDSHSALVQS